MFRFAFAYQGNGSGANTYLAGGAKIDLQPASKSIDIKKSSRMDVKSGQRVINMKSKGKAIDLINDRNSIDL